MDTNENANNNGNRNSIAEEGRSARPQQEQQQQQQQQTPSEPQPPTEVDAADIELQEIINAKTTAPTATNVVPSGDRQQSTPPPQTVPQTLQQQQLRRSPQPHHVAWLDQQPQNQTHKIKNRGITDQQQSLRPSLTLEQLHAALPKEAGISASEPSSISITIYDENNNSYFRERQGPQQTQATKPLKPALHMSMATMVDLEKDTATHHRNNTFDGSRYCTYTSNSSAELSDDDDDDSDSDSEDESDKKSESDSGRSGGESDAESKKRNKRKKMRRMSKRWKKNAKKNADKFTFGMNYFLGHLLYIFVMGLLGGLAIWGFERGHTNPTYVDAWFTAVSANCVTGLSVVDISKFKWISQATVLLMIWTGGITLTPIPALIIKIVRARRRMMKHKLAAITTAPSKAALSLTEMIMRTITTIGADAPGGASEAEKAHGQKEQQQQQQQHATPPSPSVSVRSSMDIHRPSTESDRTTSGRPSGEYEMLAGENFGRCAQIDQLEYHALIFVLVLVVALVFVINMTAFIVLGIWSDARYNKRVSPETGEIIDPLSGVSPWWFSFFVSISAFNNAGFAPFTDNLMRFVTDVMINLIVMLLTIFGNTCFPLLLRTSIVLIYKIARRTYHKKVLKFLLNNHHHLTLHLFPPLQTRIYGLISVFLHVACVILTLAIEANTRSSLSPYGWGNRILISAFHSVSSRSSGFNTVDLGTFSIATLFVYIFMMRIKPQMCCELHEDNVGSRVAAHLKRDRQLRKQLLKEHNQRLRREQQRKAEEEQRRKEGGINRSVLSTLAKKHKELPQQSTPPSPQPQPASSTTTTTLPAIPSTNWIAGMSDGESRASSSRSSITAVASDASSVVPGGPTTTFAARQLEEYLANQTMQKPPSQLLRLRYSLFSLLYAFGYHIRQLLIQNNVWLLLIIFAICLTEDLDSMNVENNPIKYSFFRITFEVVSAFGNVGLTMGYPGLAVSYCGIFRNFSKILLIVVMIMGRHRGLKGSYRDQEERNYLKHYYSHDHTEQCPCYSNNKSNSSSSKRKKH